MEDKRPAVASTIFVASATVTIKEDEAPWRGGAARADMVGSFAR